MPSIDIFALLAIGSGIFIGALQMKPHKFVPILILVGWGILVWGIWNLFKDSDKVTFAFAGMGLVTLTVMAIVFGLESFHSARIENYIRIWERNFESWDGGEPNEPYDLTETIISGERIPKVISRSIQRNPATFTPIFQSPYDSIEINSHVWITFEGKGLQFDNDQLGKEWRQVPNRPTGGNQFVGIIDTAIYAGKSKWGPDGVLKCQFPVGTHKVTYKIVGLSKKGHEFTREGYFLVRIYDAV